MTDNQGVGSYDLRSVVYDAAVKQIAQQEYKFKQAVKVVPSSSWSNIFYQENPTDITDPAGNSITAIPRGANYPQGNIVWNQQTATMSKYGLEELIPFEDVVSNNIDVRDRTLLRIARRVAKAVDDAIWNVLRENGTPVNIQSLTIASAFQWDTASAAIVDDLDNAEQKIAEYNYDTSNLMVFISPKDKRSIVKYFYEKGAQAPELAMKMVDGNGVIGKVGNKTFIVSNSVTASQAIVVVPNICATYHELQALATITKEDPYKSLLVRSTEVGVAALTDPKAIVFIKGTQSP